MKTLSLVLLTFMSTKVLATGSACSDFNTQTRIAREAVKSLIALADVPNVEAYYGGVQNDLNGLMTINVQPHYKFSKDWYKVTIRNSDCRVVNINLFLENLPLE